MVCNQKKVKNNLKNQQLNVGNDVGWLFGLQVLLRKSQKCKNKFSQKLFRETLMVLDTDPILAYGLVVQKDLIVRLNSGIFRIFELSD